MKCYNHITIDAVGICKNCNKGVCIECLSEFKNGIACKGNCTEKVKEINRLIDGNINSKNSHAGTYKRNGILYLLMGLVFVIYGTIINTNMEFIAIMGVLFLVGSIFSFINAKNQKK
jgi:hypothetical protein